MSNESDSTLTTDEDSAGGPEPSADADVTPLSADPDRGSYRMLMALVALLLIGLVVAVVVLRSSDSTEASGEPTTTAPGRKEPLVIMPEQKPGPLTPFSVTAFDGQALDSESLKGTPLVLNFWASWCVPCRKEMPAFQQVSDEMAGRIRIVGLASDDGEKQAREFAAARNITYSLAMAPDGYSDEMGVFGLPSTFLVDADGNVVEAKYGELSYGELTSLIAEKLGVSTSGDSSGG